MAIAFNRDQRAVLLISLAATTLLLGYEFVRNTSDTYFKAAYGPENLPIVMALIIPALMLAVHIYGICLSRWGARKTLWWSNGLSALSIVALYTLERQGWRPAAGILFIVRQCYVVLIIEQYWSFLNSTLAHQAAVRYYGVILGLSTIGPIIGDWIVWQLAETVGYKNLLLMGAAVIVPSMLFADRAFALCGEPQRPSSDSQTTSSLSQSGVTLLWQQPLLGQIALVVALTQVLSTFTTLNFQTILFYALPNLNEQTAYSGGVNFAVNSIAFALQLLIVPWALRRVSLRVIHLIIPTIHVVLALSSFLNPSLGIAAGAYCVFKAFDYSLFRAAKEILYIPLSFDGRYRAKQVIDSFGYRFSKGITSLGITVLNHVFLFTFSATYPAIGAVAAGAWAAIVIPMTNAFHRLSKDAKRPSDI